MATAPIVFDENAPAAYFMPAGLDMNSDEFKKHMIELKGTFPDPDNFKGKTQIEDLKEFIYIMFRHNGKGTMYTYDEYKKMTRSLLRWLHPDKMKNIIGEDGKSLYDWGNAITAKLNNLKLLLSEKHFFGLPFGYKWSVWDNLLPRKTYQDDSPPYESAYKSTPQPVPRSAPKQRSAPRASPPPPPPPQPPAPKPSPPPPRPTVPMPTQTRCPSFTVLLAKYQNAYEILYMQRQMDFESYGKGLTAIRIKHRDMFAQRYKEKVNSLPNLVYLHERNYSGGGMVQMKLNPLTIPVIGTETYPPSSDVNAHYLFTLASIPECKAYTLTGEQIKRIDNEFKATKIPLLGTLPSIQLDVMNCYPVNTLFVGTNVADKDWLGKVVSLYSWGTVKGQSDKNVLITMASSDIYECEEHFLERFSPLYCAIADGQKQLGILCDHPYDHATNRTTTISKYAWIYDPVAYKVVCVDVNAIRVPIGTYVECHLGGWNRPINAIIAESTQSETAPHVFKYVLYDPKEDKDILDTKYDRSDDGNNFDVVRSDDI